jgi:hypothetical protein
MMAVLRGPPATLSGGYPAQGEMRMRRLLLALVMTIGMSAVALAADVTGKWVGSVDTPNGPLELTFELKTEGEAVTGTVGSAMGTLPISNGKLAGDVLTFDVVFEAMTIKHECTVNAAGDEIAIKSTGDWGTSEYVVKKVAATQ